MTFNAGQYDAIVIGAGHAGVESALACARLGLNTLLTTMNLDSISLMACNPAIGGTSKGHLVREVDALGGEMGVCADKTLIQIRMLNTAKGPAVHSLRAQMDKKAYQTEMKRTLENQQNLTLKQTEVTHILHKNGVVTGVDTVTGGRYVCKAVVVATGVYLQSRIIMGETSLTSGPSGLFPANRLTESLIDLGFSIKRFKTGTPARVDKRTIDFSKMEIQHGDHGIQPFSFMSAPVTFEQTPCYLTYTSPETLRIVRENLHRSPMYAGNIKGIGARYCPSIEDKVVRFADKERHQLFIEPEGLDTNEMYVQGFSTSMPEDVQIDMIHSVIGLENAKIMRLAYAIEYDCIDATQLSLSLESKNVAGLFCAGQINGSSGYEEAAAQGVVAGINAAMYISGKPPVIIDRSQGYIGVLIDDLVTKGTDEPYRMMTSRAEYRLQLRQDNADMRLTEIGRQTGLVTDERYDRYTIKKQALDKYTELLKQRRLWDLLKKDTYVIDIDIPEEYFRLLETESKYEGYIQKQHRQIEQFKRLEGMKLSDIDYEVISGLRIEARQKLSARRPENIGQASRISGVSPADISVLMVWIHKLGMRN